jgi:hypothetical protein
MSTNAYHSLRSIRTLLVTIAMVVASTLFLAGTASADVLIPRENTGGSGGGGGAAQVIDEAYAAASARWATIAPFEQGILILGESQAQARQIDTQTLTAF